MELTEHDQIAYLANLLMAAHADTMVSPKETSAIDTIRESIGARKPALAAALKMVQAGNYRPVRVGTFATQVANVADMLYVCCVDGEYEPNEKALLSAFGDAVGLTGGQMSTMVTEAIARAEAVPIKVTCGACGTEATEQAKFCASCGSAIAMVSDVPQTAFEVPTVGYAVEFCESTAAGFPAALNHARTAPSFASMLRNKKTWYLASGPDESFSMLAELAHLLAGIRTRKGYHAGKELPWDELFGFSRCASERRGAYRPTEYCFGGDDNRVNPWGCKQIRMEWTDWARWFSYGQFQRGGFLQGRDTQWVFDKERIRHEAMTNLHRYRYCPHLRPRLVEAVLRALPDQVTITANGPWKYNRSYDDAPGGIKVVEVEKDDGFEFKNEYIADGVRPRDPRLLKDLLTKAFGEAGVTDVGVAQLLKHQ